MIQGATTSEWSWANNDQNLGDLRARVKALAEATSHSVKMVLVAEPRTWRAEYGAEHLLKELEQLVAFKPKVDALADKCKSLMRMHKQAKS